MLHTEETPLITLDIVSENNIYKEIRRRYVCILYC